MKKKSFFFHNLDLIRFIAFIMVFISHIPFNHKSKFLQFLDFNAGNLGVELFFVLSGFLITTILLQEKNLNKNISLIKFYARRIFRIFPLYFGIIFIIACLAFFNSEINYFTEFFVYYLPFLGNFDRIYNDYSTVDKFIGAGVLWSIGIEEQFYILIPFGIYLINQSKYILTLFITVFLATFFFKLYVIITYNDYSLAFRTLNFSPFSAFDSITAGCILSYITFFQLSKIKQLIDKISFPFLIFMLLSLFAMLFVQFKINNIYYDEFIAKQFYIVIFAIIIAYVCFNDKASKKNTSLILFYSNYLGKISFGLYVYHFIVIHYISKLTDNLIIITSISLTLTIVISWLSYNYFERPFLLFKQKFATVNTRDLNATNPR